MAEQPQVLALFPFPHELEIEVVLADARLVVVTTLRATGSVAVPAAFGYHPYFTLPDAPRSEWQITLPVRRRAILDEHSLPTGRTEAVAIPPGRLGDQTFDDLFPELEPDPTFEVRDDDRSIAVTFGDGYDVAVVYAPADDAVICFEPMTAPTDPFEGEAELAWVEPGETFSAEFSIAVMAGSP